MVGGKQTLFDVEQFKHILYTRYIQVL